MPRRAPLQTGCGREAPISLDVLNIKVGRLQGWLVEPLLDAGSRVGGRVSANVREHRAIRVEYVTD